VPDRPRWTVLLPTHDAARTLAPSIRSVLAQGDGDLEVLLVADGVSDATRAVVAGVVDERVRVFDLPKADGYGYLHRRRALETAAGRYIAFASDDDLWAPDHLARLGRALDAGAALAHSTSAWVIPDGRVVPLPFALEDAGLRGRFAVSNYIPSTCFAITSEALAAAGGWPVEVPSAADWTLWRAVLNRGERVTTVRRPTALHFRSALRSSDHPVVDAIAALADRDGWPGVRIEGPPGEPLQAAAVVADPVWWDHLETALAAVVGRAALIGAELLGELAEVAQERDRDRRAAADAVAAVERDYLSSTSWRLTAPLRALGAALRRRPRR
jgi:hypothetical protein